MNNSFNDIAKTYGFLTVSVDDADGWRSKIASGGKSIGIWDGKALKIQCDTAKAQGIRTKWENAGFVINDAMVIEAIDNVWKAFEYFSDGDLDYLLSDRAAVEFPVLGQQMIGELRQFRESNEQNPDSAATNKNLSDHAGAVGNNPFLKNLWGKMLSYENRVSEAGKAFREAVDAMPTFAEPYSNLGILLWNVGQRRDAFVLFTEAFLKNPHSTVCQLNFFDAGYELQEYASIVTILEDVIPKAPQYPEFQHHLAIAYQRTGRMNKAINILERILKSHPDDEEAKNLLNGFREESEKASSIGAGK